MSKHLDPKKVTRLRNLSFQGEDADEDDAYQVLSTLKRITAFHKYEIYSVEYLFPHRLYIHPPFRSPVPSTVRTTIYL